MSFAGSALAQGDVDLTTQTTTRVRNVIDVNGDGVPERIRFILVDSYGRSVGYENDVNGDGVIDYRVDIRRDHQGRPLTIETDINGDGIADSIEHRDYDESGVRVRMDVNGDGVFDSQRVLPRS